MVVKIKNFRDCRASLQQGVANSDKAKLESGIAKAREINFPNNDPAYVAAVAELERIKQEEALLAELSAQMARGFCNQVDQHTWDHSVIDADSLDHALQVRNTTQHNTTYTLTHHLIHCYQ